MAFVGLWVGKFATIRSVVSDGLDRIHEGREDKMTTAFYLAVWLGALIDVVLGLAVLWLLVLVLGTLKEKL